MKDSSVSDLNKKNSDKVANSDNYFIPYGNNKKSTDNKKENLSKAGSKDNASKKMHMLQASRPKPPDYDEAWYEDPSDGQWYNQYDWYEDECGEWMYDYRMEEYGYTQNELGEWVPMESGPGDDPQQVPSLSKQSSRAEDKGQSSSDKKRSTASLDRGNSKDGFSQVFSETKSGSEISINNKSSLPPRPPDYDNYWYQAEDGGWYNEYDDMGLQFADPDSRPASLVNDKDVPKKDNVQSKTRPKDYDQQFYQDEFGVLRNKYDDKFEDEDCYTEEELLKIEERLRNESNVSKSKVDPSKAVEPKPTVIDTSKPREAVDSSAVKNSDITKKKKLPKPADFEEHWFQDYDGNWQVIIYFFCGTKY